MKRLSVPIELPSYICQKPIVHIRENLFLIFQLYSSNLNAVCWSVPYCLDYSSFVARFEVE